MKSPHAHSAQCANWRARQRDRQIESLIQENQRLADRVSALEALEVESVIELNQHLMDRVGKMAAQVAILMAEKRESVIEQNQSDRQSPPPAEPRARVEDISLTSIPTESKGSKKKTNTLSSYSADFEAFWDAMPSRRPHSNSKAEAAKRYQAALKQGADPNAILHGARSYARNCRGKDPQYVCMAATWLQGKRWQVEIAYQQQPQPASHYPIGMS